MPANIFLSYSHEDEAYRDRVEKHLALLKHEGLIMVWHDHRIGAGEPIDGAINRALETSDVILLLISAGFMSSNYCYSKEMTAAMERHADGRSVVIPVIIHPCDWHSSPFGGLKATPDNGKAVSQWANIEEAYSIIARDVRAAVGKFGGSRSVTAAPVFARATPSASSAREPLPRSSNLRLKKEYSDLDQDTFLKEAFAFIARFFEGSLHELAARNPGIEGRFERVDHRTIVGSIYKAGNRQSQCSIHLGAGALGRGITYSNDASARGNSYNEKLTVNADDQSMFLRSMGMATMSNNREGKLSAEGGAELFWGMLMQRLQ